MNRPASLRLQQKSMTLQSMCHEGGDTVDRLHFEVLDSGVVRSGHRHHHMEMFRSMLKQHLITEEQFVIIDTKMKEKYKPIFGGLCPEKA